MDGLVKRLNEVLEWSRLSQRAFAKRIDYSPTSFNNYILGKREGMDAILLMNILSTYLEINPDWLLHGEGDMLREVEGVLRDDGVEYKPYTPPPEETRQIIEDQREIIKQQRDLIKILQEQLKLQQSNGLNEQPDVQEDDAAECADASGW